jgi:ribosomal protein L11 methyltransferase
MNTALATKRAWWKISVRTSSEAEDAVSELLCRRFGQSPVSYTDIEAGHATVSIFQKKKPDWCKAARFNVRTDLNRLTNCGLNIGPGSISLSRVLSENWAEAWKRHFPPLLILSKLLVKPPWSRRQVPRGHISVIINPGLSFGTGHHATTQFCLEQLVTHQRSGKLKSFLDIGTGSGILAIAAAKLDYETIAAFDADVDAVRIARTNARLNRVPDHRIHFWQQDLARLPLRTPIKYSLVCANLISNLLLAEQERIVARMADNGLLVLAGILKSEFSTIQRAFLERGLRLVAKRTRGEWCSGSFCWRPQ